MTANLITRFVFTKSAKYISASMLGWVENFDELLLDRFSDLRKASGDKLLRQKYFREKMEAISIIKLKMRL